MKHTFYWRNLNFFRFLPVDCYNIGEESNMKLIERELYLNKLKELVSVHSPDIKVLTGVRRAGKSKLLEKLKDFIMESDSNSNIIHINYNLLEFSNLLNYLDLNKYVEERYKKDKNNYILIDEIQMCDGFEKAINSFHASEKYDIYITGSNAFLLSSDLATLFTGRVFEIKVYPFSFKEFLKYFEYDDIDKAFEDYFMFGGMSSSYIYKNKEDKFNNISSIYNTLILKDVLKKYRIKNSNLLEKVSNFLMDNIGNKTSANNISNYLTNNNNKVSHTTIGNYIKYLCDDYVFYKIPRYDIKGKRTLTTDEKYYLVDQSFRFASLGTRKLDYGRVYENIVAIELLRRGYEVYVGTLYDKEIDFVAIKREEKLYIQVSYNIDDENTFKREVKPLLSIKDNYPKILITRTKHQDTLYEGIKIFDIARWLSL